jgi:hypothetical protein
MVGIVSKFLTVSAIIRSSIGISEMKFMSRISPLSAIFLGLTGCASVANSALVVKHLKIVSAGHTGCLPDENEISNVKSDPDGSGTWNATCNGRVYLCSAVASVGNSESYNCAPVAK